MKQKNMRASLVYHVNRKHDVTSISSLPPIVTSRACGVLLAFFGGINYLEVNMGLGIRNCWMILVTNDSEHEGTREQGQGQVKSCE